MKGVTKVYVIVEANQITSLIFFFGVITILGSCKKEILSLFELYTDLLMNKMT